MEGGFAVRGLGGGGGVGYGGLGREVGRGEGGVIRGVGRLMIIWCLFIDDLISILSESKIIWQIVIFCPFPWLL